MGQEKRNKKIILLIILCVIIVVGLSVFLTYKKYYKTPSTSIPTPSINTNPNIETQALSLPIADFKARVTKKPFGIYITPQNSPVRPERFTGYHTGADVEYEDIATDVPVYAINDGTISLARTASGYGGVIIIETNINNTKHSVLYGHIRPSSLSKIGTQVKKGEQIGVLGKGYTTETDKERKHLHFGVLSDNRIDLKGYVQKESELSNWINPMTLYK